MKRSPDQVSLVVTILVTWLSVDRIQKSCKTRRTQSPFQVDEKHLNSKKKEKLVEEGEKILYILILIRVVLSLTGKMA